MWRAYLNLPSAEKHSGEITQPLCCRFRSGSGQTVQPDVSDQALQFGEIQIESTGKWLRRRGTTEVHSPVLDYSGMG
jgi:hypothetical protein